MRPDVRGCVKCGYNLAGLPAAGTVVTCPECGHPTDLAYRPPRRMSWSSPVRWGTVPAALGFLCAMLNGTIRDGSGATELFLLGAGLLGGAITAAVLKYKMVGREPGKGRALRPF